jgi:hypothetical protein
VNPALILTNENIHQHFVRGCKMTQSPKVTFPLNPLATPALFDLKSFPINLSLVLTRSYPSLQYSLIYNITNKLFVFLTKKSSNAKAPRKNKDTKKD